MFYNSHTFLFFSRLPHPKVIDISYDDWKTKV
jgi:hypothetical protein